MKRVLIPSVAAATIALVLSAPAALHARQRGAAQAPDAAAPAGPAPRMADGHPDLSGVWWTGGDVGGRGYGSSNRSPGARGARGARGQRGGPGPATYQSHYNAEAAAEAARLSDKDDPTLRCIPTAFGTLNVSFFDVGAVGQIISTPKFVVMLTETYHGFRLIPTDGRPHRDNIPPSYRGDSVGHWEGDVFVVDTTNFTDNTWMSAEGRVSPHSDALHIVERYRRVDAKTLEIEATVEDSKMLTAPWVVPKQRLVLAPFDEILSLNCTGIETQALMDGAAKQE